MNPHWSARRKVVYAICTAALTFALMTAWGIFIRPYTDGFSGWLGNRLGSGWALVAILVMAGLVGAYGLWPRHDDPPPVVIRKPMWVKILIGVVLAIPAVSVVVGLGSLILVSLYRN